MVVAHPDDESFGLGAVISHMTAAGAQAHILCYTHGEASTLGEHGATPGEHTATPGGHGAGPGEHAAGLGSAREAELRQASAELGAATLTLLGYPDGRLASAAPGRLAAEVTRLVSRYRPDGLLVFDDTGITGHPDHQAVTAAAVRAAASASLPVLAWALPEAIARQLRAETGQPFTGQPPHRLDLCVRLDRTRQRRAARAHTSQLPPAATVWRRFQLQGECEHLRWLISPSSS